MTDEIQLERTARALQAQGRTPEAIEAYQRLLARFPAAPNSWYNLARLQRRARRFEDALLSYQRALDYGVTRPEEVHLNRGVILSDDLRQYEAAERELDAALRLNPAYVPALLNLANLHEDRGDRESALRLYERILDLDPRSALALARYANLKEFADRADPLIGRLRQALGTADVTSSDQAALSFALGRALDACGDYPAAFESYTRANRLSRASAPAGTARYDRLAQERCIDRIIASFPAAQNALGPRDRPPHPIFVCGMFRSGSTLIEQLLGGHPQVTSGGELDLLPHIAQHLLAPFPEALAATPAARLQALAELYLDSLIRLFPGAQRVTDKRPDNFLYLGLIKRLFPQAMIVHTVRDPLDNCLSIFFLHLDQGMSYALDLQDIGHYYRQYQRLMRHWKRLFGADICDVSYDELVRTPRPVMERLLAFLGLDWDDRCVQVPSSGRIVRTASVWEVRRPLYTRSSGRARHYAAQLSGLRAELAGLTAAQQDL